MKNAFFIFILVVVFLLGFFLKDQITGEFIVPEKIGEEIDLSGFVECDTCLHQTRLGINCLPSKEMCCDTMKRFFKCVVVEDFEVFYGAHSKIIDRQCYNNKEGELKLYFSDDLEEFCKREGYI